MDNAVENRYKEYKKADFLDKYDTVIFDMDGVITAENHYWDSAALTVYQYINGNNIDAAYCMEKLANIRAGVFMDDKIIKALKDRGVNSNWDLGYVTYLLYKLADGDFEKLYEFTLGFDNILDIYDEIAEKAARKDNADFSEYKRNGRLWQNMKDVFQEWFLGDDMFRRLYGRNPTVSGKRGLVHDEEPIISMDKLKALFYLMHRDGIEICVGTGRPYYEIYTPMYEWGLFDYFKKDGFITYDTVVKAERELKEQGISATLTKPSPYMFLKALFGENYPDEDIIGGKYDSGRVKKALVVGDAGADILAAKAAGFDFAAVLTGVAGDAARGYFEDMKADYIFASVEDFVQSGR